LPGISIKLSDEYENAEDSIRVNREFDSNEIDESDLHHGKHDDRRISISETLLIVDDDEKLRFN
jgi:hypothetical protein